MENRTETKILIGVIVTLLVFGCIDLAFACSGDECKKDSNVADINDGNKGYIFTYYCEKGAESLGKWVDPETIPELKGEKGDTGEQGIQGLNGINGINGMNGVDGVNGINGIDGKDGLNGEQGIQGEKGDKGDTGKTGKRGKTGKKGDTGKEGYTPIKNVDYFDGLNGVNGLDGKDVDPKEVRRLDEKNLEQDNRLNNLDDRLGKLEQTQFVLETSFRILDTKRISIRPFLRQNFTRSKIDMVGLKIDIKLGSSYEEKLIKKVNARLDLIEKIIGNAPIIEKVVDNQGNIKSVSIVGNGLNVNGKF